MRNLLTVLFHAVLVTMSAEAATYGQKAVAAVLLGEARGEGRVGMTAVAEVIRTRADARGVTGLAVISRPRHFSCLNGTTINGLIRKFEGRHPQWDTALRISRLMYNNPELLPGYAKGANHFTKKQERPYWARGKLPVVIIGNHAFYRL